MSDVQWLLQSNHPNLAAVREIERILVDQGNVVSMVALQGRTTELPEIRGLDPAVPIVCYGPSFVPRAYGHPDLDPGIFFDPALFRWSSFLEGWGSDAMLSAGRVVAAAEAAAAIASGRAFVRPDEDSKAFDGGLFDRETLAATIRHALAAGLLAEDTAVIIADPVAVDAEWRMFVVGGEVVAASSYRFAGRGDISLHVPHRVVDLGFEAADHWSPADVFCLDVALSEGRYGIVEANCFNASRFYSADAAVILAAVSSHVASLRASPCP